MRDQGNDKANSGPNAGLLKSHKIVFIAGLHRSGTSILHRTLRSHPDVTGFENTGAPEDEGQHLQTLYPPGAQYGGEGWFGFRKAAHLTEASSLISLEDRHQLLSEWKPYWELDRLVLVEKSPPSLIRTRFLQGLFPEAFFIIIMRHPVAVSYSTQKWSSVVPQNSRVYRYLSRFKQPLGLLIKHWLICHRIFLQDQQHLKRVYVLKYESFIQRPAQLLNEIYEFLDITPHPYRGEPISNQNVKYFSAWRKAMNTFHIRRVIHRYEPQVNPFGYSLKDLEWVDDIGLDSAQ